MPTIRKRNGKYQVQVRRRGRPALSRTFHKLSDARAWAVQTEAQVDRGDLGPHRKSLNGLVLSQLVKRYLDEVVPFKRGADVEVIVLGRFLRHPICRRAVAELTVSDFAKYRDERLRQVSAATVRRQLNPVRHMLRTARECWDIPVPTDLIEAATCSCTDARRERRLKANELARLLEAAQRRRNPYILPITLFALETAMRRGELLALRWNDVDLDKGGVVVRESKNGHSRRIPLSGQAVRLLQALPREGERVFPTTANAVRLVWQRLVKDAGLDDLHFHDLRHEAISRLFEAGLTVPEVASISGHRDPRMLFRYAHANMDAIRLKLPR